MMTFQGSEETLHQLMGKCFSRRWFTLKQLINSRLNIMQADRASAEEQKICVGCGFCCDGTLFVHAVLNPGERGTLPEKIEENAFSEGEKDYFRLPCRYFTGKCSIYESTRAHVCGAYRCRLLRDCAEQKLSLEEALAIVRQAELVRSSLFEQYRLLSGHNDAFHFMKILRDIEKIERPESTEEFPAVDFETFRARCNIFEALLIKHFRPAGDFERLMTGNPKESGEIQEDKVNH
jgi:hypothetical protein